MFSGKTLLMTLYYRYDDDKLPVAYSTPTSTHWITGDDLTFIATLQSMITPNMTTAQFNAAMEYMNNIWTQNNAAGPNASGLSNNRAGTQGKTPAQWDAICDNLYVKMGGVGCLFAPPPLIRSCVIMMTGGYFACNKLQPLQQDPPAMPIGYIWCKPQSFGDWTLAQMPTKCGPDPNELMVEECLDDPPWYGAKYGYWVDTPALAGNVGPYMYKANCWAPSPIRVVTWVLAMQYAICAPIPGDFPLDAPGGFAVNLADIYAASGGNPIPYACVDHRPH